MSQDIFQLLRSAAKALLAQGSLHVELLSLEWTEEKSRLFRMMILLVVFMLFGLCGLLSLAALIVILSWGTQYQMLALFGIVGFFLIGALIAILRFRTLAARSHKAFSGTIAEVGADLALIRDRLGD